MDDRTKKAITANILIVILGGRKLTGLILTLVALVHAPQEAYATIAMIYGMFVGGNGWEHFTNSSPANGKEATGSPGEPEGEAS